MADFYRDIIKIIKRAGCTYVRPGKGDHEIWFSPVTGTTFAVDPSTKSRHTANGTLRDAGLPKAF